MANFTMDHIIPLIIAESQLHHATNSRSLIHRLSAGPSQPPAQANRTNMMQHAPHSNETCTHCSKGHPSDRCWKKYGCPGQQTSNQRGGHSHSNRGGGNFIPHSSGQRQTRTEEVTTGEVPEEAEEIIKEKAVLMKWMLSLTPSKLWTIWK
jgi:hypothetical protein